MFRFTLRKNDRMMSNSTFRITWDVLFLVRVLADSTLYDEDDPEKLPPVREIWERFNSDVMCAGLNHYDYCHESYAEEGSEWDARAEWARYVVRTRWPDLADELDEQWARTGGFGWIALVVR